MDRRTAALSRRALLATPLAACGAASAGAPLVEQQSGLIARARRSNRFFGTAVNDALLRTDQAYMSRIGAECGIVVGESQFKWGALRPHPDAYALGRARGTTACSGTRRAGRPGRGSPRW